MLLIANHLCIPLPSYFFRPHALIDDHKILCSKLIVWIISLSLSPIGIGLLKRKLANTSYPTIEFFKDENDVFTLRSHTVIKTSETSFRLNEEFEEDRLDGKRVKSVVVHDGNKYIQTQKDGDLEIKYIREVLDDQIRVVSLLCARLITAIQN